MTDVRMADTDDPGFLRADETRLTRITCPDCDGALVEIDLEGIHYHRCHVGRQYGPQSFESAQRDAVEAKLWAAAAALKEHAALARHLAHAAGAVGDTVARYHDIADRSAQTARSLLDGLAEPAQDRRVTLGE